MAGLGAWIKRASTKKSFVLLVLPVIFLVGFGVAVAVSTYANAGSSAKRAAQAQMSAANVAHTAQAAVESTVPLAEDMPQCFPDDQPVPSGTMDKSSMLTQPASVGSSDSDESETGAHGETDSDSAELPAGHPEVNTEESKCPRSQSGPTHP